ncbi:MAG: hypothetical protein NTW21_42115 [Verrucomicrobia bacterium]|nr:hypothetical protein [Verrucomicrobiota bacterium]
MKLTKSITILMVSGAVSFPVRADGDLAIHDTRVSEPPQVQAFCGGSPVKRFGFCWVLGEAPTHLDDAPLQAGNTAPRVKVHPKDSSRIQRNYIGVTTTRMPRSTDNDYLPVEAIHLIDGDLQTCWMSRGQTRPSVQPIWIRLDFPIEHAVTRVVLRKRPLPARPRNPISGAPMRDTEEVGRGMPATITLKVSQDADTWRTFHDGPTENTAAKSDFEFRFDAQPVKQIWITAGALPLVENILHAFSIAEVEVYDEHGTNIALASRGTGVTVNSTYHGSGQELAAHRWYWPLHYDAGFKWARVGYHDDPINWHWVEKQKGVLAIDPETDKAVTELVDNGVEIIMSLGFGNRLYSGPATRDVPQLWEWNYSTLYPRLSDQAAERSWCGNFPATEMEKAKYVALVFTRDSGLGIESFFCEMYCPTYGLLDLSLLRRSFDADPIAPLQPQAAYYVTRNLATLLDGLEPATFECSFEGAPPNVESFMFTAPDGRALALWQGGRAKEHCARIPVDVRLKSACRQAVACDPVNGVQQDMLIQPVDGGMRIQGVLVGDSPLIIRLRDR